ncbi:MAG: hypothetical protein HYY84_15705 [Deltaproteobacteria bacterium]|nr:hypothetical protein [Deltaproteobacteria bacterium]
MKHFLVATALWGLSIPAAVAGEDTAAGAGAAATAKKKAVTAEDLVKGYAFRGSTVAWSHGLSVTSLNQGAEPTYNPNYNWLFRFSPRLYLADKFSLRLKVDLAVEMTDSDDTNTYREPQLADIQFDAVYGAIKEKATGLTFTPSIRFVLPTSKASQARSLYMGVSPGLTIGRNIKFGKAVELDLGYAFRYTKSLNKYTTVQYESPTIANCGAAGGDCAQYLHTGVRNPSHAISNAFTADLSLGSKLKLGLLVAVYNSFLYDLTPATATLSGGATVAVGTNGNDVSHRASMLYGIELSYDFHPSFSLALGISTFNPQLATDGTYYTPFINRFSEISLSTTVALDHLVALFDGRRTR